MENFGDRIDYWDVFNEITVDHLYHNAVSRWIHEKGRANAVRYTTKLVREINPHANLLYNDFNIWNQECERCVEETDSILHGICPKADPGNICLEINRREENVEIIIADDGVGMDHERLESLFNFKKDETVKTPKLRHIGLNNVAQRLEFIFPGKHQFRIESLSLIHICGFGETPLILWRL